MPTQPHGRLPRGRRRAASATPAMAASVVLCLSAAPAHADLHRQAGDVLRWGLPIGTPSRELQHGDSAGARQFATAWALAPGAGKLLERITAVERPDGTDAQSFPSGHAMRAFVAAAHLHRRHGIDTAWPWYAAAGHVGWTRVHARRHHWTDVAGAAVLAMTVSRLATRPWPTDPRAASSRGWSLAQAAPW